LAFQAENGKFPVHHDYYRMNRRGVAGATTGIGAVVTATAVGRQALLAASGTQDQFYQ
jgi:hypothetical protein